MNELKKLVGGIALDFLSLQGLVPGHSPCWDQYSMSKVLLQILVMWDFKPGWLLHPPRRLILSHRASHCGRLRVWPWRLCCEDSSQWGAPQVRPCCMLCCLPCILPCILKPGWVGSMMLLWVCLEEPKATESGHCKVELDLFNAVLFLLFRIFTPVAGQQQTDNCF